MSGLNNPHEDDGLFIIPIPLLESSYTIGRKKKSTADGAAKTCKHGSNGYTKRTSLCAIKESVSGMTMLIMASWRCIVVLLLDEPVIRIARYSPTMAKGNAVVRRSGYAWEM